MVDLPTNFKDIELIILDMDGVITSEQSYWDVAGLVVREIIESPGFLGLSPPHYTPVANIFYQKLANGTRLDWRKYLPPELIMKCKLRGINSNWDLAYVTAGLYLAPLFAPVVRLLRHIAEPQEKLSASDFFEQESTEEDILAAENDSLSLDIYEKYSNQLKDSLSPIWYRLENLVKEGKWEDLLHTNDFYLWGDFFRKLNHSISPLKNIELLIIDDFHPDIKGLRLLDELNHLIHRPPYSRIPVFGRNTALWDECRDLFQGWYLGEKLYEQTYHRPLPYGPKPGLIHKEEPLHGRENTHACLKQLTKVGIKLGIATGRPRMEIMTPLKQWDMLNYFDPARIVTYDEVESAEQSIHSKNPDVKLSKPHPYCFLKAIYPQKSVVEILEISDQPIPDRNKILIAGDAQADIWAAQRFGCPSAALLSGAIGPSSRRQLEEAKPDVVCSDILELTRALCSLKTNEL